MLARKHLSPHAALLPSFLGAGLDCLLQRFSAYVRALAFSAAVASDAECVEEGRIVGAVARRRAAAASTARVISTAVICRGAVAGTQQQ